MYRSGWGVYGINHAGSYELPALGGRPGHTPAIELELTLGGAGLHEVGKRTSHERRPGDAPRWPAAPGAAERGGAYSNTRSSCWGGALLQIPPHSGPLGIIVW